MTQDVYARSAMTTSLRMTNSTILRYEGCLKSSWTGVFQLN